MFVIIKNGGKQYKVQSGDIVKLDSIGQKKGSEISFKNIIACNHDSKDYIGTPYLKNVEVKAEVLENKKDKKILVFKKRRRHNSRRLNGHRQCLSIVKISDILMDGKSIGGDKKQKSKSINKATKKKVVKKEVQPKKE